MFSMVQVSRNVINGVIYKPVEAKKMPSIEVSSNSSESLEANNQTNKNCAFSTINLPILSLIKNTKYKSVMEEPNNNKGRKTIIYHDSAFLEINKLTNIKRS